MSKSMWERARDITGFKPIPGVCENSGLTDLIEAFGNEIREQTIEECAEKINKLYPNTSATIVDVIRALSQSKEKDET